MKKLLEKTLRLYLYYSIIILAVTGPGFYYLIIYWDREEAEENLIGKFEKFKKNNLQTLKSIEVEKWNKFNDDIKILRYDSAISSVTIINSTPTQNTISEFEPTWNLEAPIIIEGIPFTFLTKVNQLEREDLILNILALYLTILLFLLTGLYFITKRFSLKIWTPFFHLLDQLENFEIEKKSFLKIYPTTTLEFHRLNLVAEKLINRIVNTYRNQKEFNENAAHELQTPLAIIQSKIELLLQKNTLSEQESEAFSVINDSISRLTKLNKNILLLSKIERESFPENDVYEINNLIFPTIEFLKELSTEKNISIKCYLNSNFKTRCNKQLAESLLNNLLINSLQHNHVNGFIEIETKERKIIIKNTGESEPLEVSKIFNRFSKAKLSSNGNGLGLAIAKKIASTYEWSLTYNFEKKFHVFTIEF